MNNKGQTTVFFSLILSILFLFTLTALEVVRIYTGKVKIKAVAHSTSFSIMADYHSGLFERYHLLFMDPTYGTGSEAAAEEKIEDYLESSLCGEGKGGMYRFAVKETAIVQTQGILNDDFCQLKKQIAVYEKLAGGLRLVSDLKERVEKQETDVAAAARETEINGVELPLETEGESAVGNSETGQAGGEAESGDTVGKLETEPVEEDKKKKPEDPREVLKASLKTGILAFVLPASSDISKEIYHFENSYSEAYQQKKEELDISFQDIGFLKRFMKDAGGEKATGGLAEHAAFVSYVNAHFSNAADRREDSMLACEAEYLLKGKDSDYENLEAVVKELTWMRMPVNYAYLLTDNQKKSEALTLAAAICTATGTEPMMEVVKYLLLGCWAYGESLYEMRLLLSGEKLAIVKTKEVWNTDLKHLSKSGHTAEVSYGLDYGDYLMLLFAKKNKKDLNLCYARMLEVMEKNLKEEDADMCLKDMVGGMTFQGKIEILPLYVKNGEEERYECYFEETFSYSD